ncbi:hypothetical protein [Segetibacter aerophilus]|uniref:Uncharacterized protein n=1 Tax=Segetibacter aerophilus TaxID=670293 RepID=A0A512B9W2_9BACT|nr:hypothetical protein [Segetibacter aerophilus]GEO08742.1 hypothetical protein SAE01_12380 [Segetibacter aerophilus]
MEQPISSYVCKRYKKPVAFNCVVNGKPLIAEVIADIENPLEFTVAMRFNDGVEFEATALESGKWWISDVRKLDYIKAVQDDLSNFLSVKHYQWDMFEISYKHAPLLVWVAKIETDEDGPFSIYYKGDYRFHTRKSKQGWEAKSVRVMNPEIIDERLVSFIGARLEKAV